MNIKNTKSPSFKIAILVALTILLGIVVWFGYKLYSTNDYSSVDIDGIQVEPAPAQLEDKDAEAKQKYIEEQTKDPTDNDTDDTDSSSSSIEMTASQNGTSVTIVTKLYSINDGNCTISISNGSKMYKATAEIIYQPAYSTCAGFSVPVSKLGSGSWNISLSTTTRSGVTSSTSQTLEVK